jgi:hypothetical protein
MELHPQAFLFLCIFAVLRGQSFWLLATKFYKKQRDAGLFLACFFCIFSRLFVANHSSVSRHDILFHVEHWASKVDQQTVFHP